VISWAYGVTGLADRCAPSRDGRRYPYRSYLGTVKPTLNRWVEAGYAVTRTDYLGLGTPGIYPYLGGVAAAHSVLDLVRAARRVDGSIGRRFVSTGHSSGGHAALWAAGRAASRTPGLRLRGTVAYTPSSQLGLWVRTVPALTTPSPLSVFTGLLARALDVEHPELRMMQLFSDRFMALYPDTIARCVPELQQDPAWMALAPAHIFRPGADIEPLVPLAGASEATHAGVRGRVLIAQGTNDVTNIPAFTEELAEQLQASGAKVSYRTYDAVHDSVVPLARRDVTAWIEARLRR
jgi:acetyl esterase/lipase